MAIFTRQWFRWGTRLLFLSGAVFFAIGGPLPQFFAKLFPALSPLVLLSSSLANATWYASLFWALPALTVLLLAVWRGRFFCRWICPAGTLYSLAGLVSPRRRILKSRLNGILFWSIIGGAIVGLPVLILFDPLATFNRSTQWLTGTYTAASIIPGLILPIFLLLGVIQPVIWCTHICPLGYGLEISRARTARRTWGSAVMRRNVLTGLLIGVPLAVVARKFAPWLGAETDNAAPTLPVLPPGAEGTDAFAAACTRCYACVNVCPSHVIQVNMPVGRKISQFFHPELDHQAGYCEEFCNDCTQVCPAGALQSLTIDEKRHRQLGIAEVRKDACLAWEDKEHCMVCQEHCPYLAIDTEDSSGIPCPVVNEEYCRGCGFCENKCPAIRDGAAITVRGVKKQGLAKDYF